MAVSLTNQLYIQAKCTVSALAFVLALLFVSCASHPPARTVAIINRGENLIASHGNEPAPPKTGPDKSVDTSREHLFEIYTGQQKIIEDMERRQRRKEEQRLGERGDDVAEGHAAPLPDDISPAELLRIIEKQQSLIQALGASSRN